MHVSTHTKIVLFGAPVLALGVYLGYVFYHHPANEMEIELFNSNAKAAACKGMSEARLSDIETFCNLMIPQLTPAQCLRTDYVKILAQQSGQKFIGQCAGLWPEDPRNEVPTSSADFKSERNVDPLKHL